MPPVRNVVLDLVPSATVKSPRRRWGIAVGALAALAALAALVAIVAGLLTTSPRVKTGTSGDRPLTASASTAGAARSNLPPGRGALIAVLRRATTLHDTPGGRVLHAIGRRSEFDSPQTLWVVAPRGRWLGVISPQAGNGRIGWIPRGAASLGRVDWKLRVSLSARRLLVFNGGRMVQRYRVAVGGPGAPTPTGRFDVTDLLATGNPTGPYGCCILALSALAPHAIQGWGGGNRIAIHATTDTASIGQPVSHGCLRLTTAQGRWLLSHVPLGTPTLISG
jgi:lipoprotein-anchoring transpeptidase ErfK/SrfK